jgi:hypothetical protein
VSSTWAEASASSSADPVGAASFSVGPAGPASSATDVGPAGFVSSRHERWLRGRISPPRRSARVLFCDFAFLAIAANDARRRLVVLAGLAWADSGTPLQAPCRWPLVADHAALRDNSAPTGGSYREIKMPAKSEKQRKFMGAELQRKREGKKTKTDMSEKELEKYASKDKKA